MDPPGSMQWYFYLYGSLTSRVLKKPNAIFVHVLSLFRGQGLDVDIIVVLNHFVLRKSKLGAAYMPSL